MVQSCKSGRAFRIGPGSGLSLSKYFGPVCSAGFRGFQEARALGPPPKGVPYDVNMLGYMCDMCAGTDLGSTGPKPS